MMVVSIGLHLKRTKVENSKSSKLEKRKEKVMQERRFAVQYRFNGVWFDFAKYVSEADARAKAKKLLRFGAARVVPIWC